MQVEIIITMQDLVEAVRDLYVKRGGAIPEALTSSALQIPNAAKHTITWDRVAWTDPFLEIVCREPKKK